MELWMLVLLHHAVSWSALIRPGTPWSFQSATMAFQFCGSEHSSFGPFFSKKKEPLWTHLSLDLCNCWLDSHSLFSLHSFTFDILLTSWNVFWFEKKKNLTSFISSLYVLFLRITSCSLNVPFFAFSFLCFLLLLKTSWVAWSSKILLHQPPHARITSVLHLTQSLFPPLCCRDFVCSWTQAELNAET